MYRTRQISINNFDRRELVDDREQSTNVSSAFEILLEEVEAEIDFVNTVGSKAFSNPDYDKAAEALGRARTLTAFREKVDLLRKEWAELTAVADREDDEETRTERCNLGRLRKGLRTPTEAYYIPILQALSETGGAGETAEVLDRVGRIMASDLKEVDHQPLASDPETPVGAMPLNGLAIPWSTKDPQGGVAARYLGDF